MDQSPWLTIVKHGLGKTVYTLYRPQTSVHVLRVLPGKKLQETQNAHSYKIGEHIKQYKKAAASIEYYYLYAFTYKDPNKEYSQPNVTPK